MKGGVSARICSHALIATELVGLLHMLMLVDFRLHSRWAFDNAHQPRGSKGTQAATGR